MLVRKTKSNKILSVIIFWCAFIPHSYSEKLNGTDVSEETDAMSPFESIMASYKLVRYQPRHVHLSYGSNPTEMVVTWSTIDDPGSTSVEFGIEKIAENRVNGTATLFEDHGELKLKQYIHRVILRELQPGQNYVYHCGGDMGWSAEFYFRTMQNGTNWSPKFAVYGDMGNENAQSLPRLQREVEMGSYDAILHVGDFAYDMNSDNGLIGDGFMEQIEPIAAYVPYMTCPGNHEQKNNFSHYKNRFSMPGPYKSMMYSWNMGPIHFISISTEFYYFLKYGINQVIEQYEWLKADLLEASKPVNREERPWIIVYGHRPMYCSNMGTDDCTNFDAFTRVGIPFLHINGLEDLFMENGVDLAIWAHQHSYERMFPLYNYQVYKGSETEPYKNPKALVHITTGSAGCKEDHAEFKKEKPAWTAFRSSDYGYSRLQAMNKTHLYWEQVSDDQEGIVVDSFYLIRENHSSYQIPDGSNV
ncbi:unnamed protein product [Allacma fusca]|uniref:Purple acid phosphatase n=1 Tax=Allacma fusca TaxID=39272 RepID=A0A8J2LR35_9HEXA|nr:unnamed protein product [Allacma fusca]